jgi:2-phosphosulfolactate phosphatase
MNRIFVIDSLPESPLRYKDASAVVAVDVIRATTMAITAVSMGRRCFPVDSLDAAFLLARRLRNPLLAGELKGEMPSGFEMNNSPAALANRRDVDRPLILLSSSGTRLIRNASGSEILYLACFRNSSSLSYHLISKGYEKIALLGAGSLGDFREEDQICCAWIAAGLARAGYYPENRTSLDVLNRWGTARPSDCLVSRSVDYLTRTGQSSDLRFILERIDDLDSTFFLHKDEIVTNSQKYDVPVASNGISQNCGRLYD